MMENKTMDFQSIEAVDKKSSKEEIEELINSGKIVKGVEMLLEEMLEFLAKMPPDKYHDYREFRHRGLRDYLINRFLRENWNEDSCHSIIY